MKWRNIIYKASLLMCSFAFMAAVNSLETMCTGTAYQPKVPASLEKYRKDA